MKKIGKLSYEGIDVMVAEVPNEKRFFAEEDVTSMMQDAYYEGANDAAKTLFWSVLITGAGAIACALIDRWAEKKEKKRKEKKEED